MDEGPSRRWAQHRATCTPGLSTQARCWAGGGPSASSDSPVNSLGVAAESVIRKVSTETNRGRGGHQAWARVLPSVYCGQGLVGEAQAQDHRDASGLALATSPGEKLGYPANRLQPNVWFWEGKAEMGVSEVWLGGAGLSVWECFPGHKLRIGGSVLTQEQDGVWFPPS